MRFRFLVPALVFAFFVPAGAAKAVSLADESLRQTAMAQINYLEHRHGIKFDRKAFRGATFGIPPGVHPGFRAVYIPGEGSIYVARNFTFRSARPEIYFEESDAKKMRGVRSANNLPIVLRHELGHAFIDQVSQRIGNGIWPANETDMKKYDWYRTYGTRILSEGSAGFFGYGTPEIDRTKGELSLPAESDHDYWLSNSANEALYAGGFWLVEPILEEFGERGLEYIVTHPLDFPDGRARQAAKEYQKRALAELGKKEKK
ncbi:MAG: hypothetical protein Q7S36_02585 [Candidatus Liptonbacteria bacterium]|nr:hypothetical protein [Candidatus Liptonbacteria bacterium]